MTIGKTIRKLRKERGLTLNQLAILVESDVGNLSRLERDQQGYSDQMIGKIASALNVPVAALFAEDEAELSVLMDLVNQSRKQSKPFDENVIRVPMGTRPIPVISSVQAGALRDMDCPYEPGDGYAVIYTDDMSLSRWTFSLEVDGDSMLPRFQHGDLLIVDPELSPNPGNFVVARNGTNQATFKKYRPRGIDESGNTVFELVPLNEDYPTMRSDTEKLIVLGVVVEHRNKLR